MPRPTKYTPALGHAIAHAVSVGLSLASAATLVGVAASSVKEWFERGCGQHARPSTPHYAAFAALIQKARSQDEARRVLRIEQAGKGGTVLVERTITYPDGRVQVDRKYSEPQWTADAWYLERRHPERWGRRDRRDLRLQIERAAACVAAEMGLTVAEVLGEAQALLRQADQADPP